jgi:hypothetical protein
MKTNKTVFTLAFAALLLAISISGRVDGGGPPPLCLPTDPTCPHIPSITETLEGTGGPGDPLLCLSTNPTCPQVGIATSL